PDDVVAQPEAPHPDAVACNPPAVWITELVDVAVHDVELALLGAEALECVAHPVAHPVPEPGPAEVVLGALGVGRVGVSAHHLAIRADRAGEPVGRVAVAGAELHDSMRTNRAGGEFEKAADGAPHDGEVVLSSPGLHLAKDVVTVRSEE